MFIIDVAAGGVVALECIKLKGGFNILFTQFTYMRVAEYEKNTFQI